jgi:5-methylthioadenosine/S-adenosylhomocysteine deaminase
LVPGLADDLNLYAWLEKVINPMMLNLTKEDCYWTSLLAQIEMIRSGVTCFSDHFDVMIGKIFPQLIAAVEKSGMRGVLSREMFTRSDLPHQLAMSVSDDVDRQMLADTVETIEKLRDRQGRATVRLGLGGVSYASESLIETVRSLATRLKVGMHVHAAESTDELRFFKRKKKTTPLRYACDVGLLGPDVVLAHCVWVDSEEIRMLRQTGAKVAYCPVSNMKLADGVAPVWKMLEEGVTVGLGTDGAASNDNLDMFACMKLGSYLQKIHSLNPSRLSSLKMLEIATIGGAKALQMDDQIGSIEPGKKADLTIVDLNAPNMTPANDLVKQLVCSCTPSCVDTVIIDGNTVLEDGRFTQLDEAAVVTEAKARATSLVERMYR